MKKHLLTFVAALAAAGFSLPAAAQFDMASAFYLTGSLGRAHFVDVCANQVGSCKDRDTTFSLGAGLQLNRYLGVEVDGRGFGHASLPGGNVKGTAYELDGVGTLPLYKGFSLIGRVGVFHGELKGENIAERKNGATFGWGGQYDFSPQFALRLEWQRYSDLGGGDFGAKTNIDTLGLAAVFSFR